MGKLTSLFCATGLAVAVAGPVTAQDAGTVLATVNGTDITLGHVIALQDRLPDQYRALEDEVLYNGILEQLIQQTALSQFVQNEMTSFTRLGLENETRAFLASEFLQKAGAADLNEDDVQAAYTAQYASAVGEEEFNASHILVETEEEAAEIKKMLDDGSDFATLAKEKSTGPSGPGGGELGWFGKGAMVPQFEEAVLALEDGSVSEPVQTQFGWHIVKRNESRIQAAPTLDEVRGEIENQLRTQAVQDSIATVTEDADIQRNDVEVDPALIRNVGLLTE
ncbi:MAG: peptidylprolyl isomerase [Litoreibacter sp.]|nr:peptidylprolyl isomerase [Litoreibacter sp.]